MSKRSEHAPEPSHTDICLWLDYYGELLSERQRGVLSLYYNEDWSLSEIADETGLSRQGVHDQIRRGTARLSELEEALALSARDRQIEKLILRALDREEADDREALRLCLSELLDSIRPGPEENEHKRMIHGLI